MSKTEEEILFLSYTRANEVPRVNVTNVMRKVIQAYNFWMKIPKEKCIATEEIWKLVDTSRFMLDELQNLSGSSRTKIHQDDTVAADINAANYAICTALEKCFDLDYSKAAPIYIKQTLQFHRGQGLEIYWRDFCQCPTEEEYKQMCVRSKYGKCCF
ncbi:unnamed protein product [Tenebrio molitor]|nr:unnamed protein product [Tenebrio molitor]